MTTELSALLSKARSGKLSAFVRPGEVLEVQSSNGTASVAGITTPRRFADAWSHCSTWLWQDDLAAADPTGRFLGVVHDTGAYLMALR